MSLTEAARRVYYLAWKMLGEPPEAAFIEHRPEDAGSRAPGKEQLALVQFPTGGKRGLVVTHSDPWDGNAFGEPSRRLLPRSAFDFLVRGCPAVSAHVAGEQ